MSGKISKAWHKEQENKYSDGKKVREKLQEGKVSKGDRRYGE